MGFKEKSRLSVAIGLGLTLFVALVCYAAYLHQNEIDSPNFLSKYPQVAGTKLDNCTTCHSGGSYTSGGKTTTLGSCQWCHYKTDYGANSSEANLLATLNPYGIDYLNAGRNVAALTAIEDLDSDGDGYPNIVEIAALRYPGDPNDDPTKVAAPSKVYARDQLEAMSQHTQFLLMNARKSTDNYVQYAGVPMEDLLTPIVLPSASDIMVLSPDGFSQTHPFNNGNPPLNVYPVDYPYPAANYFYDAQADIAINPSTGWCDYSAPSAAGRVNGSPIVNSGGLKMILAITREGQYLAPGVLNDQNKLDGEGPFRVVPPQKVPGPPDQRSTADPNVLWVWPYQPNGDHNAGFSSRSTTMIKVEPLPQGTTDIDVLEAGWPYIDQNKIVVYGAINPLDNIKEKLVQLVAAIELIPQNNFRTPSGKAVLENKVQVVQKMVENGNYVGAYQKLQEDVMGKMDGCINSTRPDGNDWLKDCDNQVKLYWAVHEVMVFLKILT